MHEASGAMQSPKISSRPSISILSLAEVGETAEVLIGLCGGGQPHRTGPTVAGATGAQRDGRHAGKRAAAPPLPRAAPRAEPRPCAPPRRPAPALPRGERGAQGGSPARGGARRRRAAAGAAPQRSLDPAPRPAAPRPPTVTGAAGKPGEQDTFSGL